ncbi:hypothetical protein [Mycobacteroides abscessus]|uniref:hypothetical protein n=1 Tax=Mycobacteroides abscessus TaxID=36809 RepID=UPI0009A6387F|nr:hypothetical protein [Mycobacteroides abscessus]
MPGVNAGACEHAVTLLTRNQAVRTHNSMISGRCAAGYGPGVNAMPDRQVMPVYRGLAGASAPRYDIPVDGWSEHSKYNGHRWADLSGRVAPAAPWPPRPHPSHQMRNRLLPSIDGPGLPPDSNIGSPDKPGRDSG